VNKLTECRKNYTNYVNAVLPAIFERRGISEVVAKIALVSISNVCGGRNIISPR